MIRVFPSRFEGEPLETHSTVRTMTVRAWLTENAPSLDLTDPPITLHLNGELASLDDSFGPKDILDIHIEARGPFAAIAVIVAAVLAVAVLLLMPKPAAPRSQSGQGRGLDEVALDANAARINAPVPEIFGRPARVYPDYITPPRSYYVSPRVQVAEVLLCVGKGLYQKSLNDVYIGDTPISAIGGDVEARFFEPGESLWGVGQADWWHTPQEVGFTSRGGAGLQLGTMTNLTPDVPASTFSVAGDTITSSVAFPEDWVNGVGMVVQVPYPAEVTENTISSAQAMAHFTPTVGTMVSVSGADSAVGNSLYGGESYRIIEYIPAEGGFPPNPGTQTSLTGNLAPARLDFDTTPAQLTITRGSQPFYVVLSSAYADAGALAIGIAAQLNSTGVTASLNGSGRVQLLETGTYNGAEISVSGSGATDVFGDSPLSVIGAAATAGTPDANARITLEGASFFPGNRQVAIGPPGHKYTIYADSSDHVRSVATSELTNFIGWTPTSNVNINVTLEAGSQQVEWTGPFTATPPCAQATAIEFDLVFPSGLGYYRDSGGIGQAAATVYWEWREVGTATWTAGAKEYAQSTADAIGFTERVELPYPMSIEIRMRRSPKWTGSGNPMEEVQWTGLRSRLEGAPTSYAGVTLLSVRVRSGDRVSAQSENKIWLRNLTRILPTVEDENVLAPTRDIMPAVLYMLNSVGYGRDRVDMAAAQDLHDLWVKRGDLWDYEAQKSTTVKVLANHCLKAGYAELTLDRGLIKPVRDAVRGAPQYIYSPQEFTDYPTMTTRMPEPDDVDGVDAEYTDSGTGRVETVQYRLPGDMGRRVQKITLIGITHPVRAWRLAARHRRTLAYRRTVFKGETELQALNSSYMSYDRIQDGIPGYGQSAFVVSVQGQVLRLSEAMDWDGLVGPVIAFRQMNGRLTRPYGVVMGEDKYHIVMTDPVPIPIHLGGDNRDPTMVYFGNINRWSHGVLVTAIIPNRSGRVTLEAVEYDARVYAEDDRDPRGVTFLTTDVYPTPPPPEVWHYIDAGYDAVGVSAALVGGSHKTKENLYPTESIDVGISLFSASHKGFAKVPVEDKIDVQTTFIEGYFQRAVEYKDPGEKLDVNISLVGGSHEQG